FLSHCSVHHIALHSFPTRRSSDLIFNDSFLEMKSAAFPLSSSLIVPYPRRIFLLKRRMSSETVMLMRQIRLKSSLFLVNPGRTIDRKSTRLNSSRVKISYAVFCLK